MKTSDEKLKLAESYLQSMLLVLDGNSIHVAYARRKIGLLGRKKN